MSADLEAEGAPFCGVTAPPTAGSWGHAADRATLCGCSPAPCRSSCRRRRSLSATICRHATASCWHSPAGLLPLFDGRYMLSCHDQLSGPPNCKKAGASSGHMVLEEHTYAPRCVTHWLSGALRMTKKSASHCSELEGNSSTALTSFTPCSV